MNKYYFVGGYYTDDIFENDTEELPKLFSANSLTIYSLENVLENFPPLDGFMDWLSDRYPDDNLDNVLCVQGLKANLIEEYAQTDDISSLVLYTSLQDAVERVKSEMEKIFERYSEYEYSHKIQDNQRYWRRAYRKKEGH